MKCAHFKLFILMCLFGRQMHFTDISSLPVSWRHITWFFSIDVIGTQINDLFLNEPRSFHVSLCSRASHIWGSYISRLWLPLHHESFWTPIPEIMAYIMQRTLECIFVSGNYCVLVYTCHRYLFLVFQLTPTLVQVTTCCRTDKWYEWEKMIGTYRLA